MRTLSLALRELMNAEETGDTPILLMTIEHPDLDEPIRLSSDPTERFSVDPLLYGTTSRSNQYSYFPFNIVLPTEGEEAAPAVRFRVDWIDQDIMALLRSTATPALVTVELVTASDPDTPEVTWPTFDLVDANYTEEGFDLSLAIESLVTEPYPADGFSAANFRGLFA